MSIKRWNAKRDESESAILQALRKAGCQWIALEIVDLCVLRAGQIYLLEIKTPGNENRLTDRQKALIAQAWPIHVVSTPEEALRAIGLVSEIPVR